LLDLEFFQYIITIVSRVTFEVKSFILRSWNMFSRFVYVDAKGLTTFSVLRAEAVLSYWDV